MKLYIDESGSITQSKSKNNRYFIISYVHTNHPEQVIREFRKAKKDFLIRYPDTKLDIKKEIKGSEMPYGMKKHIFQHLSSKTDATFHYQIVDNFNVKESLLTLPSIAFNYFIGLSIYPIKKNVKDIENDLFLLIDERNQSVNSLNSLEDYLKLELSIKTDTYQNIKVRYKDSRKKDLIQIADIFANTLFRLCSSYENEKIDNKNTTLIKSCKIGMGDYFPRNKKGKKFIL